MQINLEHADAHSIQAYDNHQIKINDQLYHNSLIVSASSIDTNWHTENIETLGETEVDLLLKHNPEIVLIGHTQSGCFPPPTFFALLASHKVGLECMDIGAACRTFNVLLSELRAVTLVLIIPDV